MISRKNSFLLRIAGAAFFLFALFVYFKIVTAPTRWVVWSFKNITQAFSSGAGKEVIRPEALSMKQLADKHGGKFFRLEGELKTNMYTRYPAFDYLYPVRITEDSPKVFANTNDPVSSKCHLIDELEGVALHECPIQ